MGGAGLAITVALASASSVGSEGRAFSRQEVERRAKRRIIALRIKRKGFNFGFLIFQKAYGISDYTQFDFISHPAILELMFSELNIGARTFQQLPTICAIITNIA
jgi:hypothetical protein